MKDEILESLVPLFEDAKTKNLWFYCSYQGLWFSPRELNQYQEEGRFIWGVDNWQLRSPLDRLSELEKQKKNIEEQILVFKKRME